MFSVQPEVLFFWFRVFIEQAIINELSQVLFKLTSLRYKVTQMHTLRDVHRHASISIEM